MRDRKEEMCGKGRRREGKIINEKGNWDIGKASEWDVEREIKPRYREQYIEIRGKVKIEEEWKFRNKENDNL